MFEQSSDIDTKIVVMTAFRGGKKIESSPVKYASVFTARDGSVGIIADWTQCEQPTWDWSNYVYRIAEIKPPSINWNHVLEEYKYLFKMHNGEHILSKTEPKARADGNYYKGPDNMGFCSANTFASLIRSDCDSRDSLVIRPSPIPEQEGDPVF